MGRKKNLTPDFEKKAEPIRYLDFHNLYNHFNK